MSRCAAMGRSPSAPGPRRRLRLRAGNASKLTVELRPSGAGRLDDPCARCGPGGFALERSYALAVKPSTQILTRRTVRTIAKADSLTVSSDLFSDLVPGTGAVALSVGLSTALDAAALLKALDRYPFGCSEQITSRALPLLYVNELASENHLALDAAIDQRIRDAIDRLLARQDSNGSFGLWGIGGDDPWLNAYVTDFLTRARERGFAIPDTAYKLALDRLRNSSAMRRSRPRTAAANSPMHSMCWRATVPRRSATCATSPTPSSPISRRRSPRRRSPRRSACSATAHAPNASMLPRSMRSRRGRSSNSSAAPTTARCCATRLRS